MPIFERAWHFRLDDMIEFAQDVMEYTKGMDQATFQRSRMVRDATLRKLSLIGEAARNVPDEFRVHAPDVPWKQIIATRNQIMHGYLGIDDDIVWSIVRDDLPDLVRNVEALRRELAAKGVLPQPK